MCGEVSKISHLCRLLGITNAPAYLRVATQVHHEIIAGRHGVPGLGHEIDHEALIGSERRRSRKVIDYLGRIAVLELNSCGGSRNEPPPPNPDDLAGHTQDDSLGSWAIYVNDGIADIRRIGMDIDAPLGLERQLNWRPSPPPASSSPPIETGQR